MLQLETLESRETPALIAGFDPSFSTGGTATLDFGGDDRATAVAVQPNGKIVVAGTSDPGGGSSDFAVARYNPDGSPDLTFGNGTGSAKITFGVGSEDVATGVAVQADGKIVVVGYTNVRGNRDFAFARLTATGGLDTSFDTDGLKTLDFGFDSDERAAAVAIQTDGKIVVAGTFSGGVTGSNFGIARLNPVDGSLDATFNGGGMQNVNIGVNDFATALAIQANGRIVVAGYTDLGSATGNPFDFAVVRLLGNGASDTSFDGDGQRTIDFGADDRAAGVAIQRDGGIAIAGTTDDGTPEIAVARVLESNGGLDASFDGDGKTTVNYGSGTTARAAAIVAQWDGRLAIAGTTDAGATDDFVIQRLNANGSQQASFNGTGSKRIDFGDADAAAALAIDPNGRLIAVGVAGSPGNFGMARIVGSVEEGRKIAVGGSADGRAGLLTPNASTGVFGAPFSTPTGIFGGYAGDVRVAVGDVNGDGHPDTAMITGPGTPIRFAVVNGKDNTTLIPAIAPFAGSEGFDGGGFIAVADFDNDGRAEIVVTPDQGGGPRVTIFQLPQVGSIVVRANFLGIDDASFRGGARPAAGDVNGDGIADLAVSAGFLGGPRAALFNGASLFTGPSRIVGDFFAFPGADANTLRNGSFLSIGDMNGDGFADLVFGGGPGGAARIYALSGQLVAAGNVDAAHAAPLANFFVAGNTSDRGGARVATVDADGDNRADLVVGSGEWRSAAVRIYRGVNMLGAGEPAVFQDVAMFGGAVLPGGVHVG